MAELRITKEGWKFLRMTTGAFAFCSLEYYLYYRLWSKKVRSSFFAAGLPDTPELASEFSLDTGATKIAFEHRGGPKAAEVLMQDTFGHSRFRRVLGLQFASVYSLAIGMIKQRGGLLVVAGGLSVANCLTTFPAIQSSRNLHRLASLCAKGNQEVWENLSEIRFFQRVEEMRSPLTYWGERLGLYSTTLFCMYLAPYLTSITSGLIFVYLRSLNKPPPPSPQ